MEEKSQNPCFERREARRDMVNLMVRFRDEEQGRRHFGTLPILEEERNGQRTSFRPRDILKRREGSRKHMTEHTSYSENCRVWGR
jgi:hypothetical protein